MRLKCYATLFSQTRNFYKNCINLAPSHRVLASSCRTFSHWDIVGAVCLERKPVISQTLSPLEQKYLRYIQKLEIEKSFLSDHEKREIEDKRLADKLKAGTLDDSDSISKQTAQDFEDACMEEFNKFQPSSRTTDADAHDDRRSTERKLDSSLVFVINQKLGNDCKWILPQTVHEEGETLRQTAERALMEVAASRRVQFLGNAPVGYYKYKYPKAIRGNGICGAKVFFFKAQLLGVQENGLTLKATESVSDHLWLTHSELESVLQPVLFRTVRSFLYPDTVSVEEMENNDVSQKDEEEPVRGVL